MQNPFTSARIRAPLPFEGATLVVLLDGSIAWAWPARMVRVTKKYEFGLPKPALISTEYQLLRTRRERLVDWLTHEFRWSVTCKIRSLLPASRR